MKLSARDYTTTITDGEVHIIKPDGSGGYDSFRILIDDFLSTLQAEVDAIETGMRNLTEVANIAARDALTPALGNYVTVLNNGYGEKVKYRYMYDVATGANAWIEIGLLSNIQTG